MQRWQGRPSGEYVIKEAKKKKKKKNDTYKFYSFTKKGFIFYFFSKVYTFITGHM
jgi:hypothetical protein